MKERRMFLDVAQLFDRNAAVFTRAAEIVANEIDDHRVLGKVLFARDELGPQASVLIRRVAASTRPLNGRRFDRAVALYAKEALG